MDSACLRKKAQMSAVKDPGILVFELTLKEQRNRDAPVSHIGEGNDDMAARLQQGDQLTQCSKQINQMFKDVQGQYQVITTQLWDDIFNRPDDRCINILT